MTTRSYFTPEGSPTPTITFLQLIGNPTPYRQTFETVTRPGINGVGIWNTGNRGMPFQIKTISDHATNDAANTAWTTCKNLHSGKIDLYWQGELWTTCLVIEVNREAKQLVKGATGGVAIANGGSGFLLTLNWNLQALV